MTKAKGGRPTLAQQAGYRDDTIPITVKVPSRLERQLREQAKLVGKRLPEFIRSLFEQAVDPKKNAEDGNNTAA